VSQDDVHGRQFDVNPKFGLKASTVHSSPGFRMTSDMGTNPSGTQAQMNMKVHFLFFTVNGILQYVT
jgi:hypothetical protein